MSGFPAASASKMGNLVVNPSGTNPGLEEVYIREYRWWALGMSPFWGFPGLRGDNVVIPQVSGRYSYARYVDQGTYTTAIRVCGDAGASGIAPSGTSETRFFTQLRTNIEFLWANVGDAPADVQGLREAKLILPDGSEIEFSGQFSLTMVEQKIATSSLILDVTVPNGRIE